MAIIMGITGEETFGQCGGIWAPVFDSSPIEAVEAKTTESSRPDQKRLPAKKP